MSIPHELSHLDPMGFDFRSDTVTKPSAEMRQIIASAEVGDDVYGEDVTVNKLESESARLFGKEAALFVPSGTMGNLLAVLGHCDRGAEVILGDKSHMFLNEQGSLAWIGGVHSRTLPNLDDGGLSLDLIKNSIRNASDIHQPMTQLIAFENTHNFAGGRVLPSSYFKQVRDLLENHARNSPNQQYRDKPIKLHVDGARIFNASVFLGESVSTLAENVDSVQFCLSKGLGAPVGSILTGSRDFVAKARRFRKPLGGGLRQAGILAAGGLYALEHNVKRLAEDHKNAKEMGDLLSNLKEINLVLPIETNIIIGFISPQLYEKGVTATSLRNALKNYGVLISALDDKKFRIVTHLHVTSHHIKYAFEVITKVFESELKA
eukprot:TRINITY_DN4560_c0_g2_i1.p1 TRINITY_DN4560_c0_g2~~TRINITY_DN4560_c0_g2_i1.p1  ORF type:complete len:433 (-),score=97.99 TRINITY_DN4560_c0_g2_i1:35-1165(-)